MNQSPSTSSALALLLGLSFAGCTADDAPALQTITCGQPGPIQVLAAPLGTSTEVVGEAGGRWLVRTDAGGEHHFTSVGPCGEDPQPFEEAGEVVAGDGRFWVVQGLDPTVDPDDVDPADAPMMPRVGVWPAEGGPVAWVAETEGDIPLGLVPGHGYLVLQREPGAGVGEAVIVGPDGARQLVWSDVVVDDTIVEPDLTARKAHEYRFQHVAGVFAYLDGRNELRVTQADAIGSVHTVEDVATFALGPDDASWFITRVRDSQPPSQKQILQDRSDALFHVRGTAETVALGSTEAWPGVVHPGWVLLKGPYTMVRGVFVAPLRMEVPFAEGVGPYVVDDEGRLFGKLDGILRRWDPSTGEIEELAHVPEDFADSYIHAFVVNDTAAMGTRSHSEDMFGIVNEATHADVTVAPFDGSDPWTVPERTDTVGLLPDGAVVYTPAADEGPLDVAPLLWVDRRGEPQRIDEAVQLGSLWVPEIIDGDLVFQVADFDRAGLWRATLP